MSSIYTVLHTLGELEALATQRTFVHSLDPRAKIAVTLSFVVMVMSYPVYAVSAMLPMLAFPLCMSGWGNIPLRSIGKRLVLIAPFIIFIGILNPFFDTAPMLRCNAWSISGGWVSFASLLLRCTIAVSAAVILVATTGFVTISATLPRLGVPHIFATQLLFLYRYIFVLVHEAMRMQRARELRAHGRKGLGFGSYIPLLGQLLLRTLDRAERIHNAMLCRNFTGHVPCKVTLHWRWQDTLFVVCWGAFFLLVRYVNIPQYFGKMATALF